MLLHHGDGFLIEQGAMLHCVQASTDGSFHTFRPVTMPGDATASWCAWAIAACNSSGAHCRMPTSEPSSSPRP